MFGLLIGGVLPGLAQDIGNKSEMPSDLDMMVDNLIYEPLYLVSSMKTAKIITKDQYEKINQDQVDYIRVINDPSSIHIYGDKAKNGVVLIVMKNIAKKRKHK
jgi:archaellum component FlaG (FlaF/FlaG flagellin family)